MLIQVGDGLLEPFEDLAFWQHGECLHEAQEVSETGTLFPELSQLLGGNVGVDSAVKMEEAARDL